MNRLCQVLKGKVITFYRGIMLSQMVPLRKAKICECQKDVKSHADTKSMLSLSLTDELKDSQGGSI